MRYMSNNMYSSLKEKSTASNPKKAIFFSAFLFSQVGICVWIYQVQLRSYIANENLSELKNAIQLLQNNLNRNKVNEIIVLGPKNESLSTLTQSPYSSLVPIKYDIDGTFFIWKILKKSGMISLQNDSYLIIHVDGFYQINAQMQLDYRRKVSLTSFHLRKNDEVIASTRWSSSSDTGGINILIYAKNGDRLSLYSPWMNAQWFISNKVTFFSAHYLGSL
ncbi:uncharacterized protein LOC100204281 [Hydra vulgaris]|uniref:uncharacterized protein LOC100204281 n=1 Tax=Hydra vulgaris TaxID=6087 RepID=UPI0006418301|nr:uncharacterized protein LOC100204281 [Hydra vulgaris]